jgi:outer membrane protein
VKLYDPVRREDVPGAERQNRKGGNNQDMLCNDFRNCLRTILINEGRTKMKRIVFGFLAVVASLLIVNAALAQESPINIDNVPNVIGVAVGMAPDYSGSANYKFVAAPFIKYTFDGQMYGQLLATELKVNLLNHPWLRVGPAVNYRFERNDVDNSQVDKMQKIDGTTEAGGWVGIELIQAGNPRERFIASFEVLTDIGDVYNGYNMTLAVRYWMPLSQPIDVSIGVSSTYANGNFMQTYYGVTPQDAILSGLPAFNASAGIRDVTVSPAVVYHLSKTWHVAAGFRYQDLLSSASDSPIVHDVGSSDQWLGGVGVAYSW